MEVHQQWLAYLGLGAELMSFFGAINSPAGFANVIRVYTSGTSATETIPSGASTCAMEAWGSGGGGGVGFHSGCTFNTGGGGGGGGYSRCSLSVSSQNGHTFTYTVGAAPAHSTNGNTSTIAAGTVTGFNTNHLQRWDSRRGRNLRRWRICRHRRHSNQHQRWRDEYDRQQWH